MPTSVFTSRGCSSSPGLRESSPGIRWNPYWPPNLGAPPAALHAHCASLHMPSGSSELACSSEVAVETQIFHPQGLAFIKSVT